MGNTTTSLKTQKIRVHPTKVPSSKKTEQDSFKDSRSGSKTRKTLDTMVENLSRDIEPGTVIKKFENPEDGIGKPIFQSGEPTFSSAPSQKFSLLSEANAKVEELSFSDDENLQNEFYNFFFAAMDYRERYQEILWKFILTKLPFKDTTQSTFGDYHLALGTGNGAQVKIQCLTRLRTRESQYFNKTPSVMSQQYASRSGSTSTANSSSALSCCDYHECLSEEQCQILLLTSVWLLFLELREKKKREQIELEALLKLQPQEKPTSSKKHGIIAFLEPLIEGGKSGLRKSLLFHRSNSMQVISAQPSEVIHKQMSATSSLALSKNATPSKSDYERFQSIMKLFDSCLAQFSISEEFSRYLKNGSYLKSTVNSILENSPVAFAISKVVFPTIQDNNTENKEDSSNPAHNNKPFFPLVYVNKAFESLTQYSRQDCLGKSCKFLHSPHTTEAGQIEKITKALVNGIGIKVVITNCKKDGSNFFNFLSLIPIYNREDKFTYVLAKLYDITIGTATYREIKAAEEVQYLTAMVLRGC
jgi:PAS domain S-box-containing protein